VRFWRSPYNIAYGDLVPHPFPTPQHGWAMAAIYRLVQLKKCLIQP
jgi:hypothetical protein